MRRVSTVAFLMACAVGLSHAHRGCISHNGWFYDLSSDASITTLDRYQGTTFVDRNTYAPFHLPAPGTTAWDEGVAFAATMQTRNVWLYSQQTAAGSWVVNDAGDVWTFTAAGGAQYVFTTAACSPATSPPPPPPPTTTTAAPPPPTTTAAPPPAPTGAPSPVLVGFHACISHNGWMYDLKGDQTFTQLDRFQGTTFFDRNNYAPFHLPAAGSTTWDEGVGFAATMQTRNAWLYGQQTTAATWEQNAAGDRMIFTAAGGAQYIFTTSNCV